MGLLYKPDWEEAKQRYAAWWAGRLDRCLLWITSVTDDAGSIAKPELPRELEARWTDLDYLTALNDYYHRTIFWGAEAFPIWNAGYPGHATLPTFYGCPFKLAEETGWHDPILTGEELDVSGLKVDRTGRWWAWGDLALRRARQESRGKSLAAMHAIFGVGDTLAMLRGNDRLLLDMMDRPAAVRAAEERLLDDWCGVFEHQVSLVRDETEGYATWFGFAWPPGKFYPMHCDVSYGISPATFRDIYMPVLRRQAQYLDYTIYHLDGTGAFQLVDELLTIEKIGAIQVLPGTGKPSPLHYLDVLRKVQRAGKGLHITIPPEEVPQALELLSSRRLAIHTWAPSQAKAVQLIEYASRHSVDRG